MELSLSTVSQKLMTNKIYYCAQCILLCIFFNNPVPNPMISFSPIPLVTNEYVGLNLTWRCEARIPVSQQLLGVDAVVEWRGPGGLLIASSNDGRVTLGELVIDSPGRDYRRSIQFFPLSADDMGTYSCSATAMPTVTRSGVTNGFGMSNNSLTVVGKINDIQGFFFPSYMLYVYLCSYSTYFGCVYRSYWCPFSNP